MHALFRWLITNDKNATNTLCLEDRVKEGHQSNDVQPEWRWLNELITV